MRYSTTSLSAITLCVCMMLSHHTNGMDMWSTPSSFTNNNPNQMSVAGQQWNQQPNANMQSENNNRNNVVTPIFLTHPGNSQGRLLDLSEFRPPEKMIIHATVNQHTKDLYANFFGKYKFRPIKWPHTYDHAHYDVKAKWNEQKFLVTCYRNNRRYERVKAFYDHIEKTTNPKYKREFNNILLKRMDNVQSANKEIGCFVFERPQEYITLKGFFKRTTAFNLVKHIPNIVARVMEAVAFLNQVGIAYNSVAREHIMVSTDNKNNVYGIKLLHFDRTVIFKEFAKSMARSQIYNNNDKLAVIYDSFYTDIEQTAAFIDTFFTSYGKILNTAFKVTDPALTGQVELYNAQRESLKELKKAMNKVEVPFMLFNVLLEHENHYNVIATPVTKNS